MSREVIHSHLGDIGRGIVGTLAGEEAMRRIAEAVPDKAKIEDVS